MSPKKDDNKKKQKAKDKIRVKKGESSINEFIKRPLPTDQEVGKFEDYIHDKMEESNKQGSQLFNNEEREEEIENSLSEIYKDSKGNQVNVEKMDIKKRRGIIFWFFAIVFLFFVLIGAGLAGYYYFYNTGTNLDDVEISIQGEDKVYANEEFTYVIECENKSRVAIEDVRIDLEYPEKFIFLDSSLSPENKNNSWHLDRVGANSSQVIEVRGKIIDLQDSSNVILATMHYMPSNFSSEFKKEDSFSTGIENIGLQAAINYPESILVGEEGEISMEIDSEQSNYLKEFDIKANIPDNFEILSSELEPSNEDSSAGLEGLEDNVWQLQNMEEGSYTVNFKFRVNNKASSTEELSFDLSKSEAGNEYIFLQEEAFIEVMESDLDLNLIIEGSQKDTPVDFGQKLNYTLTYANRGESTMEDVTLMAVLESEFLDWTTLDMSKSGSEKGHTITWNKEQIPELEELNPGEEGSIDFAINVLPFREDMLSNNDEFQIENYAQFNIGGNSATTSEGEVDNKSNTIINTINSDLSLNSEVRYFNDNNLPVGTGPLPPRVGETTTFKVYWSVTNNLHELEKGEVSVDLPEHIEWEGASKTSAGEIDYDEDSHSIVWDIGKLPITVYRVDAQFTISLTPKEEDKNKILVLLPASTVTAEDQQTEAILERETGTTTTKLEDDEIANISSDGRIE